MHRLATKTLILTLALLTLSGALYAQVDFSSYEALGDSLTAGYWSAGLVQTVQANSYPALIYRQATGSSSGFEQPLVTPPGIPAVLQLVRLSPLTITQKAGSGAPANLTLARPYNNLGIPGARIHDTVATLNGGLHDLILRNPTLGNTTALQQALLRKPTFATVWIGNNDALAAATSGIVIEGVTLTPLTNFKADLTTIVGALRTAGAKVAIANIPDVTSIPFVTTIPSVVVNPATNKPVLVNGAPVPLIGPKGLLGPNDHVLLTATTSLGKGLGIPAALGGSGKPLLDSDVLDAQETATIQDRINNYNAAIAATAGDAGVVLVDANSAQRNLANHGLDIGGIEYNAAFLSGGTFSYDGVHPTPFGYAVIANLFIDAINEKFKAGIDEVDLSRFVFGPEATAGTLLGAALGQPQFSAAAADAMLSTFGVRANDDGGYEHFADPDAADTPRRNHRPHHGNGG